LLEKFECPQQLRPSSVPHLKYDAGSICIAAAPNIV
jgi:hypothetical protein